MTFDFPDWQTPQAHATTISKTGVPLLRASNNLAGATGLTLPGPSSANLVVGKAVTQPAFEIAVLASMPAGTGTIPFLNLDLEWSDSVGGLTTARRSIMMTAGNGPSAAITSFITGPCRGNFLTATLTNFDPAVTATVNYTINQTSHVYERDQSGQLAFGSPAPNGFTNPTSKPSSGVVAFANPTIAAGASTSFLCALNVGDAMLEVDALGIAAAVKIVFTDPSGNIAGGSGSHLIVEQVSAGTSVVTPVVLPDAPLLMTVTNTGTVGSIAPHIALLSQAH